uniref:t-SNARE coiled-coil homology domain-containing protein n=1 Tax=Neobodo designis TaxID=312471 RepID=A0A7S1KXV6_NEODS|mmetsp:Transcript_10846/g.33614  ORF Transcript_10846/g.33614 Transcript_10846/m.33614 type:complete len:249 (+) Transcript_10846:173-919(+)|eukprot:CAMPEP_0174835194 /NCGR_PEP_ID=MMETSP1114-20130205/5284_1 /TAXON_ID=312471 /ORGANISM="Neobodo designis, Strain CCAP 1951/1" /LENGTH=248 /DNA_ID=CAMNT_0016069139 /DNA_START=170 /DNA_END=916 /DNA_ORIENTATION=-
MAATLDKLDQLRTQMERFKSDYATQARLVGTDKDGDAHRKKLKRVRQRFTDADSKATAMLAQAPQSGPDASDWASLRNALRQIRSEFEATDRETRAKENAHPIGDAPGAAGAAGGHHADGGAGAGGGPAGGHRAVRMQEFRQVDDAELLTEEALQTEKLNGILEVERDMNELQGMYHELHAHVEDQQTGLNTAEGNIDKAQTHVEKGVTELKSANKLQKSSRKKMFILLAIIAIIVIVIIVVVVVTKK